jgi:hypothetical protein
MTLGGGCGVVTANNFVAPADAGALYDGPGSTDGAPPSPDASSCQPADVETYVPGGYHPATAAWQGVCTMDQFGGFYDACLGPGATSGSCSAYSKEDAGNGACAACILTPDSAAAYGPLIEHGTFIANNVAGCIQLTLPSQLSCAKAEAALVGCELAACEANCPVADQTTRTAYDNCALAADGAGCQSYAQMATCAAPLTADDAGASASCLQSFKSFYDAVVPLFCGAPPAQDAGLFLVEAGVDAAAGEDAGSRADAGAESGAGVADSGGHDGAGPDAAADAGR